MSLGLIVTLTHKSKCVDCGENLEAGETVRRIRGYGYEHLNCDPPIDPDGLSASKSQHPANTQ